MSKPSERGFTWDDDDNAATDEIYTAGERIAVQKDEKTVGDDLEDYVYLRPKRRKKRKGKSKNSPRRKSHSNRRKNKMKTWKKVLISIACVLLALIIIAAGTGAFLIFKGRNELFSEDIHISAPDALNAMVQDDGEYIVYNGATYKYNADVTSMLFMGVDKETDEDLNVEGTGGQADVVVLMALDLKNRKLTMLNIPRDTMADVSLYSVSGYYIGMEKQQICLAYAYGDGKEKSCENTLASVKRLYYNLPVSTYYELDLYGLPDINDAVGGVDVVSPETIEKFEQGKEYHLMGNDARRFVEARVTDRADASILRSKRHQVYAKGFLKKAMDQVKEEPAVAVDLYNKSAPYSCTSLNASRVMYLAQDIARNGSFNIEIVNIPGNTTLNKATGQAEYVISEKEFYEQFLSVFYEKL